MGPTPEGDVLCNLLSIPQEFVAPHSYSHLLFLQRIIAADGKLVRTSKELYTDAGTHRSDEGEGEWPLP
jgi:hypothetical protein